MKLVQTCLYMGNTLKNRLRSSGGGVKHVQPCLSASKDGESSFHLCGSRVKLHGVSLFMCGKHRTTPFSQRRRCFGARAGLFKYQKGCRKQFSHGGGAVKFVQACLCAENTTTPWEVL